MNRLTNPKLYSSGFLNEIRRAIATRDAYNFFVTLSRARYQMFKVPLTILIFL